MNGFLDRIASSSVRAIGAIAPVRRAPSAPQMPLKAAEEPTAIQSEIEPDFAAPERADELPHAPRPLLPLLAPRRNIEIGGDAEITSPRAREASSDANDLLAATPPRANLAAAPLPDHPSSRPPASAPPPPARDLGLRATPQRTEDLRAFEDATGEPSPTGARPSSLRDAYLEVHPAAPSLLQGQAPQRRRAQGAESPLGMAHIEAAAMASDPAPVAPASATRAAPRVELERAPVEFPSASRPAAGALSPPISPPPRKTADLVIEHLDVEVVMAPQPTEPSPAPRPAREAAARTGALRVASRYYLGRY